VKSWLFVVRPTADSTTYSVIVVLDAEGKALVTQDSGKLEEGDHHNPKKVLAFSNEWAAKKS